jgi:SAM-dependent methyltransferase
MAAVFAQAYADVYDALYADKDYGRECDAVEAMFARHATRPVRSLLDVGCGTGRHAVLFAERGYRVTGVDLSGEMLALAKGRADRAHADVAFIQQDARDLCLNESFDAAVMMFAVLGYQTENRDVRSALASCRKHLAPGSLLVCDVWYGPTVLSERPGPRIKEVDRDADTVVRWAQGRLDPRKHLCHVDYRVWNIRPSRPAQSFQERHTVRYFFPCELELFLETAGMELVELAAFPDIDRPPSEQDWNVLAVARRVDATT